MLAQCVLGRGGSNINAIRELSGAHIEVEKQSKGQGDRTILIKGSADATRLANQWISAIIASPDKDLADIVGRQQFKQLSKNVVAAGQQTAGTAAGGKNVVKPAATTTINTTTTTTAATSANNKSKGAGNEINTAAAGGNNKAAKTTTVAAISTAVTKSGTKPVTSTSFAAIAAAGQPDQQFGIVPTGPPPVKANMTGPGLAMMTANNKNKKDEEQKMNLVGPGAATPLMAATNITAGPAGDKDYSPFSPFKMPGNIVNWGQSVPAAGNNDQKKVNSEATFKGFPAAGGEDMSKAPGYRTGNNSGNINISPGGNSQNNAAGQIQPAAAGNWTSSKPGGGSNVPVDNNQLYQTQERCNSAPGM